MERFPGLMKTLIIFALIGAFVGFLRRPTGIMGQPLPLSVVLTRGATLHGLGRMERPLADRSFDTLLLWVGLGVVAGVVFYDVRNSVVRRGHRGTKTTNSPKEPRMPPNRSGPRPE